MDKIKRRPRNHRVSTGKRLGVSDRDVWGIFRPLYEHGHLPTTYLHDFAKDYTPSLGYFKHRLKDLFHEDMTDHGGAYLRRVAEHKDLPDFDRYAIYDLTRFAEQALEERGYQPLPRSLDLDFDPHRFMVSCAGASLELAVKEHQNLAWESRAQLLRECGKTMHILCHIAHNGYASDHALTPDDLFGVSYENKYWRLFAVECDRGNEPYERANLNETSLHAKFLRYREVITSGGHQAHPYNAHFNRKCGMVVLFIFTTTSKMQGFLKRVEGWNGAPCTWILAKTVPSFGKVLSIPPVMRELLTTPWHRAGLPPVDIREPKW